jgi:molybdopterin-guanine dinucleotide biosynthesis protein A
LEIAKTAAIAIMPCDMPLLHPEIYQNLYNNLIDQRPIAAEYQRQIQPLVSIWPKELSKDLKCYLNDNQTNVRKVLQKLDVQKCQISAEPLEFLNINTRIDYRILLQSHFAESHATR